MPRHLHYDGENFAYWTTTVDNGDGWDGAYVTYADSEAVAKREAGNEWGGSFLRSGWDEHLARAKEHGCSAYPPFRCEKIKPLVTIEMDAAQ